MAGGPTDVLEGDVEQTDIFENRALDAHVDDERVPEADHGATEGSRPAERADTLPLPRDEKKLPDQSPRDAEGSREADVSPDATDAADSHDAADSPDAVDFPDAADSPGAAVEPDGRDTGSSETPVLTAPADIAAPEAEKARESQHWTSRLVMLLAATVALAGFIILSVAIARELRAANASDDVADLGYSYVCDKVSGSDPGVYGVGNCHASGGMQASGLIPVGQAYVLTPRSANSLGYTQSFSCSGGRADSPSMVVPKRCAAIGNPVLASH